LQILKLQLLLLLDHCWSLLLLLRLLKQHDLWLLLLLLLLLLLRLLLRLLLLLAASSSEVYCRSLPTVGTPQVKRCLTSAATCTEQHQLLRLHLLQLQLLLLAARPRHWQLLQM
jgi:hypothetical protein